jgi:thiol-disulfide isomerase/thioredoxin
MGHTTGQARRPWARRLLRWGLEAGVVLALVAAVHWYRAQPLAEGIAPALQGRLVENGQLVTLEHPAQRPVLVHFWATWCPICKLEEGSIEALSQRYPVITVAMQSGDASTVRRYLEERSLNVPTIADPSGAIAARWGVQTVPASFILDREGRIRFRSLGYRTGLGLRARLWLAAWDW